ncbi:hypothetical protein O0555_21590 [Brevibacillus laterosporus]|uniref:hypothetical protein n=1 Tax=Brevibacillus laterosporus TaxID=1465 RepID=UPI0018CF7025|nr:hypothetical protein [Brevibacillus laterosporus]MBG9797138.1 hypothetical protein [Brevibacillus laterosporus]MCR8939898.1 hypothetical protein [Brevibacillus laterosporus]MCZ0842538.1 hypothetical protein [Brevibacillus laterosporus]MCZ0847578.1 hypothetical protein [Brevibacillus laterosporus]MED1909560.1 hypothetical protein [Brevibacillus laterosporus]
MNKGYQLSQSEKSIEVAHIEQAERHAYGPRVSGDGPGAPIDAPIMLTPGIYVLPPLGSQVAFTHTEDGTFAGAMTSWPEEALEMVSSRSTLLPQYNPGDTLIFAAGTMLNKGTLTYQHFKADGTVTLCMLDASGKPISEETWTANGIAIKTKSYSVVAESVSIKDESGVRL